SRIDETIDFIASRARVGNIYVNRNVIGAVVGVQPFGGEGKSGTGPKAGGPLYIKRLQHNPTWILDAPVIPGVAGLEVDRLLTWAKKHEQDQLVTLCQQYARTTLLGAVWVLPGPTGERNTLSFAARGTVLCVAASVAMLLNQVAAVIASGSR